MEIGSPGRAWPKAFTAVLCAGALVVSALAARPFVLDELALRRLASGNEAERWDAAAWLARRRCVRAIPALLAIPKEAPSSFAGVWPRYVAMALDKLVCPDAAQVVKALPMASRWEAWRIQATLDCGDRSDEALEAVAKQVGYEHLGIAPSSALGAFGRRAVPGLVGTIQGRGMEGSDLEHIWSHCVCLSLSAIGPAARDAIPELLRELARGPLEGTDWRKRDEVIDSQSAAAFALGSLGEDMLEVDGAILESPGAARRLGLFLAPEPKRAAAAEALARLSRLPGQAARVRAVIQCLEDGSRSEGLVHAGSEALSDTAENARNALLSVLAEIDAAPAALTGALRSHLRTGDDETRVLAARVLLGIEGQRDTAMAVLLELAAAEKTADVAATGAIRAIDALGEAGTAAGAATSLLERLLGAAEPAMRARAALALARIDPDAGMRTALKALFSWLDAEDVRLHTAVAEALGSLPASPAAVPLLTDLLARGDPEVRSYAVLLLLRVGVSDGPAIAALRSCIANPGDDIAPLAAFALHVLGDDSDELTLRAFSESSRPVLALLTDTLSRAEPTALDLQAYLSLLSWPEAKRAWQRAGNGAFLWSRLAIGSAPLPSRLVRLARDPSGNATMRLRAALAAARAGPAPRCGSVQPWPRRAPAPPPWISSPSCSTPRRPGAGPGCSPAPSLKSDPLASRI